MQLKSKCIPFGSLPYNSVDSVVRMQSKFFEKIPQLSFLPSLDNNDNIERRSLSKIPGIKIQDRKILLKTESTTFKNEFLKLDSAFNSLDDKEISKYSFESAFLKDFLHLVKTHSPETACVNLLGPFSISQMVTSVDKVPLTITDKTFRKLLIESVAVKAVWIIREIKKVSPNTKPIIFLEENSLNVVSELCRKNEELTPPVITGIIAKVSDVIKSEGAYVAVQCLNKCNWQIAINAGIDMISFDAYNNPDNLSIIPETITDFLSSGGRINWGIVPTVSESIVKSQTIDSMAKRMLVTFDSLASAEVPRDLIYSSASVSVQGSTNHLPIIFAEKAILLANHLAKKIPTVK